MLKHNGYGEETTTQLDIYLQVMVWIVKLITEYRNDGVDRKFDHKI